MFHCSNPEKSEMLFVGNAFHLVPGAKITRRESDCEEESQ